MRVIVFGKANADTEAGVMPTTEQFEAMSDFNRQLVEAGVLQMGEGLTASSNGKRITLDGDEVLITDGPFAETKEIVAGFSLWTVKDMDEAVAWAKKCPNPTSQKWEMEIRPLIEFDHWEGIVTPEIMEQEKQFKPPLNDY